MKKIVMLFIASIMCIGIVLLSLPRSLMASTSAEKQVVIDKGLAWLASTQQAGGYWNYGGYEVASTASALLAFTEQKYKPLGWNGADYSSVVTNATNYLLSQAQQLNFSGPNWWGFNGTGGTGHGIQWNIGGEETYQSGLVLPALSRLVTNPYGGSPLLTPSTVISSGNAVVNGKTYTQVIQQAVDGFTYYQTGPAYGNRYGGWRYYNNENDSDMSTTQWPVVGYLYAKQVPGVTIPDGNVKTALQAWLTVDQNPVTGGVDYQPGAGIINATHAGAFLLSNLFAGGGGDAAKALNWLNEDWLSGPGGIWWGNEGQPYAMWGVYKGLESLYGTTGAGPITNLHGQTTSLDSGAAWNWWEDYCQFLVLNQNSNGYWPGYEYWSGPLEAGWYINILNATEVGPSPTTVPEPATLLLLGFGLAGLGVIRKKKKI
jgi:hypothetical protein